MKNKVIRKILCIALVLSMCSAGLIVSATQVEDYMVDGYGVIETYDKKDAKIVKRGKPYNVSNQYKSSHYYTDAWHALVDLQLSNSNVKVRSLMNRVADLAYSQRGYKSYHSYLDNNGKMRYDWTGLKARNVQKASGGTDNNNTEYTRWFYNYVMRSPSNQYDNVAWCAMFVSWCLYQCGYQGGNPNLKEPFSSCADPRIEVPSMIETSFNLNQDKVWYTPVANNSLYGNYGKQAKKKNINPNAINYKRGGLLFFDWDASGGTPNHVGIVLSCTYNARTGERLLTYISGNDYDGVRVRTIDLNKVESFLGHKTMKNSQRIWAYAEY